MYGITGARTVILRCCQAYCVARHVGAVVFSVCGAALDVAFAETAGDSLQWLLWLLKCLRDGMSCDLVLAVFG